jgi:hypothetical protein
MGRSTRELLALSDNLQKRGADLVSLSEAIDTTTACGKMVFGMLAVLAEFERNQTSERTRTAMRHKRSKGGKTGGASEKFATMKLHVFFLLLPGPAPARLSKRVIARRIHPRMRQKMANGHYLILGKAVLAIVEGMRLTVQLHRQPA